MTKAAVHNIVIQRGTTFEFSVTYKTGKPLLPVNLTGCLIRCQFREEYESTAILAEFTILNGKVTMEPLLGKIKLRAEAQETTTYTWASAVYDIEIVFLDGTVRRPIRGKITIEDEVTR